MNRIEFDVALVRSGFTAPRLAEQIGMSKSTMYRKIESGNFDRSEIIAIRDAMHLTDSDMLAIFFDERSCENATAKEEQS